MTSPIDMNRPIITLQPSNPNPIKYTKIQNYFYPKECILIWLGSEEIRKHFNQVGSTIALIKLDIKDQLREYQHSSKFKELIYNLHDLYELETLYLSVLISRKEQQ